MNKNQLPRKLSDLLAFAIAHMDEVKKDSRYIVDMDYWHSPHANGKCLVCLAGSVMVRALGFNKPGIYHEPANFPEHKSQLAALDYMRRGNISQAFALMGLEGSEGIRFNRAVTKYNIDAHDWLKDMAQLEKDLREAGY